MLFLVISSQNYVLQLLKNLKLCTKLGPKTIHKYSHQNLLWSFVDYQLLQKYFCNWNINYTTASSVKSISGVTLSENAPGSIKCLHFDTIILPTLKICKLLKKLCAASANDHVLQSFEFFLKCQNKFLIIC